MVQNISVDKLAALGAVLKTNTVLQHLSLANTRATELVARELAEGLRENKTLQSLNVESNYISGNGIVALLEAVNVNQTVTELRVANQVSAACRWQPIEYCFVLGFASEVIFNLIALIDRGHKCSGTRWRCG